MNKATKKKKTQKDTITGIYLRTKMRNFEDGYTVFDIRCGDKVITCTGNIIPPKAKIMVTATGEWADSAYGKQLQRCTLREVLTDKDSFYEYLLRVPHVGPNIAKTVAEKLDVPIYDLLREENPVKVLMDKTGIHEKTAESIVTFFAKNKSRTALFNCVSKFGSAYAITEKLYRQYGEYAYRKLLLEPYRIGAKAGLPFSACDKIAQTSGVVLEDNLPRLAAAAEYAMLQNMNDGDCCVPLADIAATTRKNLSDDDKQSSETAPSTVMVATAITAKNELVILDHDYVYDRDLFWQEERSAYAIHRIARSGRKTPCDVEALCAYAEEVCGVTYAEQQREAFKALANGGLCVLTGGPGTGKTTVVKGLLVAYEKLFPNNTIRLCAPTGRASQRMKEATGREACTVHRLLEYRPFGDSFACKNEADQIDADLIVVDESSMISIDMAELLFNAIRSGTMVLLVGDTAQLPSVGPGNVLADIIKSGIAPVFALTKTHRQGAGSPIIENAGRISRGEHQLMQSRDFEIIECSEDHIATAVRNQYIQYHKKNDPFAVQVLTTTRKDPLNGCKKLSKLIQQEVNPNCEGAIRYGDTIYYIGDKVMMLRNNYNLGYFNGDVGTITATNSIEVTVEINGETVKVPTSMLEDMSLAYASTIHKSQGSEYDVVIAVLPSQPITMLQRNILYTAITRAKKRVVLIASDKTIFTCVNTVTSVQRKTLLAARLRERMRGI